MARPARISVVGALLLGVVLLAGVARGANPCAADVEKFCSKVPIGGGRIQACLNEHEKQLSPACAAAHASMQKQIGSIVATCREDISRFCSDVSPGGGRIAGCLQEHRSELSPACADRLKKAK